MKLKQPIRCLLIVDNPMGDYETLCQEYDQVFRTLFVNQEHSMFARHLNYYDTQLTSDMNGSHFYLKQGYGLSSSCLFDISTLCRQMDTTVDIVGQELDAGIYAICFQLWDLGIDFRVLTQYCKTNCLQETDVSKEQVVALLKRQFGDCIV